MPAKDSRSETRENLQFLRALCDDHNAAVVQIVGRDPQGKVMSVSVHAKGALAIALLEFLESEKFQSLR